jgi:glyoxylase-like metal-dependent hydrolase (beta-lactamase superfamily II)
MSEPKNHANKVERVTPEILNWHLRDDRINFRSDAYALARGGRSVLIDPLPLAEPVLKELGEVEAICITGTCHQRSAWRYRRQFGVKVHAPEGAEELEEQPDAWYRAGDRLPGGLVAVHVPGPAGVHYAFQLDKGDGALFCADVLYREKDSLGFIPDKYQDDPKRTRDTARRLLDLRFGVLCFSHGAPLSSDPHGAIRKALEADRERS